MSETDKFQIILPKTIEACGWNNIFLVVLYKKRSTESATLNSLFRGASYLEKSDLVIIWNNGPLPEKSLFEFGVKTFFINFLENKPLSEIYNKFSSLNYKNLVILDDDTDLTVEFLDTVKSYRSSRLGLPDIIFNGQTIYPKKFEKPYMLKKSGGEPFPISISSGMVLPYDLANFLKCEFGQVFDQRFKVYGVDTSFFYRLQQVGSLQSITRLPPLEHKLSKYESVSLTQEQIRLRTQDLTSQIQYYYRPVWGAIILAKLLTKELLFFMSVGSYHRYYPGGLIKCLRITLYRLIF